LLLIAVIGSGIMAQNLSPNDIGLELLENAAATGAALGAYCFTSSTSSANPAVTIARTLSDTFAGIAPSSVIPFVIAQFVGAAVAVVTVRVLWPGIEDVARAVVVPHQADAQMPEVERV
jgi:glycerol uptake facilitator-like aquaporin